MSPKRDAFFPKIPGLLALLFIYFLHSFPAFSQGHLEGKNPEHWGPDCIKIRPGLMQEDLVGLDPSFDLSIKDKLLKSLEASDADGLLSLFHPRLKEAVRNQVLEALALHQTVLKDPLQASILSFWFLHAKDGAVMDLRCEGVHPQESVTVSTHYGYPFQLALWIQLMGEKELGRVFVTLVPKNGTWVLASFHTQKWTHLGRSPDDWVKEAGLELKEDLKISAYIKLDFAKKLYEGSSRFQTSKKDEIGKKQDSVMSRSDWEQAIQAQLSSWKIPYMSSIVMEKGVGLFLRVEYAQEVPPVQTQKDCQQIKDDLSKQPWFHRISHLRCGFLIRGEDPKKDGVMGSFLIEISKS